MNQKQLLILVMVLAVLGGAGVMLVKNDSASWQGGGGGEQWLAALPVGEELDQFLIQSGSNTVTLAKVDNVWSVKERNNYPADYSELSRTILKLRDLKAVQTEQVEESELARLELLEPGVESGGGTLLEFKDKSGAVLGSLLLGKEQTRKESQPSQFGGGEEMDVPVGRWVMKPDDKTHVALMSDPLSDLQDSPASWLNKEFFKVQKAQSIGVDYSDASTNSFELARETESGSWSLPEIEVGKELDASKTSSFNYALSSPSFDDVIVEADDAKLGLDQPTVITVDTFDGFDYKVRVGELQDGKYPVRVTVEATYPRERKAEENEDDSVKAEKDKEFAATLKTRDEKLAQEKTYAQWTYLVPSWTLDSVLKKRGDLLKEKEKPGEASGDSVGNSTGSTTEE